MNPSRTVGIDFGTHKTLVARWDADRQMPILVRLRPASGDDMPTSFHISAQGETSFGDDADERAVSDADGYLRAFKRDLGKGASSYILHSHERSAREVTTEYLKWLKSFVENESLHGQIEHAVMTVPVTAPPVLRKELQQAARDAGFASYVLLDEPAAAGLAFLKSRPDLWQEGNLLVFDWGAGTLDLAVLDLNRGTPRVIPELVSGRSSFGGEDIDRHLLQMVNQKLVALGLRKLERREPEEAERLRRKILEWKIRHASKPDGIWQLSGLGETPDASLLKWTSAEIAARIKEKIQEASDECAQLLARAQARDVEINGILMIGGSSQFPALKSNFEERFPDLRVLTWENRISAVALGAAWAAADGVEQGSKIALHVETSATLFDASSISVSPRSGTKEIPDHALPIGEKLRFTIINNKEILISQRRWWDDCHFINVTGVIDNGGGVIPVGPFEQVKTPSEGLTCVKVEGKWGYIDKMGRTVMRAQWHDAAPFEDGLARVIDFEKWGCINKSGDYVIPPIWQSISAFKDGMARIGLSNKYGFIDQAGQIPMLPIWDEANVAFSEGLAVVEKHVDARKSAGYVDKNGKTIAFSEWSHAYPFSEGLGRVLYSEFLRGGGFVDRTGKLAISTDPFRLADDFSDSLAAVKEPNGKSGYIDKTGKLALSLKWDSTRPFRDGLAMVRTGGSWEIINKGGVSVAKLFGEIEEWIRDYDAFVVKEGDRCKLVKRNGLTIIEGEWDCVVDSADGFIKLFRFDFGGIPLKSRLMGVELLHKGTVRYYLDKSLHGSVLMVILNRNLREIWRRELPAEIIPT